METPMKRYTLPDLPYDYSALEPRYSGRLLELHHGKHHAAYVAGANATLDKLAEARDEKNFAALNQLQKSLAFHISGHVLHSLFWKNMTPQGGGRPERSRPVTPNSRRTARSWPTLVNSAAVAPHADAMSVARARRSSNVLPSPTSCIVAVCGGQSPSGSPSASPACSSPGPVRAGWPIQT